MVTEIIPAITKEDIQRVMSSKRNAITDEVVALVNQSLTEPEFQGETLLDTMVTYEHVLNGRSGVGIKDYIHAIRFCAYLMTVDDNYTEAYKRTFAHRDFVRNRLDVPTESPEYRNLTTAASRYRRSKLVTDILTLSQIPLDLMFVGKRYKAIGVLAAEMENAKYSKDRIMAAKELLAATKGAENVKIDIGIGAQENNAVQSLMDQLAAVAARQKTLLESGISSVSEFGSLKVIDVDDDDFKDRLVTRN
jgi:hypothetical protein